ncbi:MAG: MerR family transcriptional regulator [Actinomycetota bacterium]|nr:MerR family transcriptional regulator [Actinomycetota bacterium]
MVSNVKMGGMWISELSRLSGLPIATIKFYLRDGLLPAGEAVGATRAHYDDSHVRRLRLIRALVEVAGLRLEAVRSILAAVEDESLPLHQVIGTAHVQLSSADGAPSPSRTSEQRVDKVVRRWRWHVSAESAHRAALARALDSLDALDQPISDDLLDDYADAMISLAQREVASVDVRDAGRAIEIAVIGTVLLEPVLLTIRRMAQEHVSERSLNRPGRRR